MATNRLLAAALELQEFCIDRAWRFCFIGGLAVQHWGEARVTRDADLVLFTGIGDESSPRLETIIQRDTGSAEGIAMY